MSSSGPTLKKAKQGEVVLRFAPEPSGYLHVGHAKAALLNEYFKEKYDGRLLLRFDDTNPAKENDDFVQSILSDLKTLKVEHEPVTWASDFFDELLELTYEWIDSGKAYADDTPTEKMREERLTRTDSKCRENTPEQNREMFEQMKRGEIRAVIRAKWDMTCNNGCMRDPVLWRVNTEDKHHRLTEEQWPYLMFPTYDFSCPIIDAWQGITHALRSAEYTDREELYYRILVEAGIPKDKMPSVYVFSRMNLQYTILSKRYLRQFVFEGFVESWWDPRMPTIRGLIRRGLTVDALKEFVLIAGASKAGNLQEWGHLWNINKKVIDPTSRRFIAVPAEDVVEVDISGAPLTTKTADYFKKNPALGEKTFVIAPKVLLSQEDASTIENGEKVTMMNLGNCVVDQILTSGAKVTKILMTYLPEDMDFKGTKKLSWVPDQSVEGQPQEHADVECVYFDHLITKPSMDEGDIPTEFMRPNSRVAVKFVGDYSMLVDGAITQGSTIQIERVGYFYVDAVEGNYIRLHGIPDGKTKASGALGNKQ